MAVFTHMVDTKRRVGRPPARMGVDVVDEEQPTNGDAYRARLRRAVEDDLDALADHLYSGLVERLPDYEASTDHADDIRAAVKHGARLVVSAVFDDSLPSSEERSVWRVIGAQRARGGLRRETMAAAPTLAMQRGFAFVLGKSPTISAAAPLATAVLLDIYTRLIHETTMATEALLAGYDEQRTLDLSESTRPQAALVDRLLSHVWDDRDQIIERGRRLGADLTCPHGGLLLLSPKDVPADLTAGAKELSGVVPETLEGSSRTSPRPHVVLLVPARRAEPWRKAVGRSRAVAKRHGLTIVTIEPLDLLDMLEATYRRLLRSLSAITATGTRPGTMTTFCLEYHWLLNRPTADERANVIRTVLGPILDTPKAGDLLDLLDALYETREGDTEVARVLGIHPNTVNKWKRIVRDLTGLSLSVPADAHQLFTARIHLKVLLASRNEPRAPQGSV
jgi:sugar diacid utilization regulator